jgi:hypothetical protein
MKHKFIAHLCETSYGAIVAAKTDGSHCEVANKKVAAHYLADGPVVALFEQEVAGSCIFWRKIERCGSGLDLGKYCAELFQIVDDLCVKFPDSDEPINGADAVDQITYLAERARKLVKE